MDKDGNSEVTELEFSFFMLKAMGKVGDDDLKIVSDTFEKLDTDGSGAIDKNDLVEFKEGEGAENPKEP